MNPRHLAVATAAALGFASMPAGAQQAPPPDVRKPFRLDEEKPIPRAVPVATPIPAPRAVPIPVATPTPIPRATAAPVRPATPKPAGVVAPPKPMTVPEPEDPGVIRLSPTPGPKPMDQAILEAADQFYAKAMYDMAAPEYERFLSTYPTSADRPSALFRLGECYRRSGSVNNAKNAYEVLLSQFTAGDFIGPAAYRLAQLYYDERKFHEALPLFRRATVRLKDAAVTNSAKFFTARTLEALGQKMEARMAYEELSGVLDNNPFHDASQLSLAILFKDASRTADALKQIEALAKSTANPNLKVEATVRAGQWLLELNQPAKAEARFKEALALPEIGKWKDVAQIGLMQMLFDAGKYDKVLASYTQTAGEFSPEAKPELVLMAANSYRALQKHPEAIALYEQVLKEYPNSVYAKESGYGRLVSLYSSDAPNLATEVDNYLVQNPEAQKRDQVLMMKAEVLFRKQDYQAAAPIYAALDLSKTLAGTLKAEAMFKLGFCYAQLRDSARAVLAFTAFIDGYPTHKSIPYALVQRGIAQQQQKNFTAALKDYNELIAKHPKAKERELALEQKGMILGQQGDNAGMSESFELLLRDYPGSTARAKAHYWIGWVAFEQKNYKKAAEHLAPARDLNKEEFFERASLRVLLAQFYLEDREAVAKEIEIYKKDGKGEVPVEILRWLGEGLFKDGQSESAEKYYALLAPRAEATPDDFFLLGRARLRQQKFSESLEPLQTYLRTAKDPVPRATGLLELSRAQAGLKQFDAAQKSVDEALTLQPEGSINGDGRISAGDIQMGRGHYEEAAKIYQAVGAVLDDESVTPRALEKAVEAYKKAGKEPEAKKTLNTLQSRYPEYLQRSAKTP